MADSFGKRASETANSLMQEETRQKMKESMYNGVSNAANSATTNLAAGADFV